MKILVFLITLSLIFMTSCSSTSSDIPISPESSQEVDISPPAEFLTIPIMAASIISTDNISSWNDYLKEKYSLNLEYSVKNLVIPRDILEYNGFLTGVDYVLRSLLTDPEIMIPLKTINIILSENEAWQALPEYFKNAYIDPNGNIYAIIIREPPVDYTFPIRQYNGTMMDSIGGSVPTTTAELHELLTDVKASVTEVTPMITSKVSILSGVLDVLRSYGVSAQPYNNNQFSPVQYSNSSGNYVDIVNTANFTAAAEFLRSLYDNDLMETNPISPNNMKLVFKSYSAFSYFGTIPYDKNDIKETFDIRYGSYIETPGYNHAVVNSTSPAILMFPGQNMNNPTRMLNRIINSFYSCQESLIEASYGVADPKKYTVSANEIVVHETKIDSATTMNYIPIHLPRLIGKDLYYDSRVNDPVFKNRLFMENKYISDLESAGLYQPYEFFNLMQSGYSDIRSEMCTILNTTFFEYLEGNVSFNDFLVNYTAQMKVIGAEDEINKLNQALNLIDFNY